MASEVVAFENVLRPLTPRFEQALGGVMPVAKLMRSIMISVERTPKLLQADRQSLLNAAMSAACLGLEVDGVTGQAFFVPFAGKAQLIIGYKGMNTLGARSGFTIQGDVVREGDDVFDFELGDRGFVKHRPKLGNKGAIIASWATATSLTRPAIISVIGIDDIMAIMAKSPGAKMSDSPWKDKVIGFPAMASKSSKRRLSRSMPLNADPRFQLAATMEENFEERGRMSWIDPQRGVQIEGEAHDGPQINHDQRDTAELLSPSPRAATTTAKSPAPAPQQETGAGDPIPTAAEYFTSWTTIIRAATNADQLAKTWADQIELRKLIDWTDENDWRALQVRVRTAVESMRALA